jgi:hypothetical protein
MTTYQHFEQLWESAEEVSKAEIDHTPVSAILLELRAKLAVYEALDNSVNIPADEKRKLKAATFGKILFSLTQLSLKDGLNSFTALKKALDDAKIDQLEAQYHSTTE